MNHDSNVSSSTLDSTPSTNRWAIILAGGDGTRLRSLTRTIAGDERPKQFCSILGEETLLEQTRRPDEAKAVNELYSQLPDVDFSQHVLDKRPPNLAVLAVSGLSWNDLGRPHRVFSTLAAIGNRRYTQSTATSAAVC